MWKKRNKRLVFETIPPTSQAAYVKELKARLTALYPEGIGGELATTHMLTEEAVLYGYFYNRSGDKMVSKFVQRLDTPDGKVDTAEAILLADITVDKYGYLWNKIYDALSIEYELLWNTDAHVQHTETLKRDGTDTDTMTYGKTENRTRQDTEDLTTDTTYGKSTAFDKNTSEAINQEKTVGRKQDTSKDDATTTEASTTYGKTTGVIGESTDNTTDTTTYGKTETRAVDGGDTNSRSAFNTFVTGEDLQITEKVDSDRTETLVNSGTDKLDRTGTTTNKNDTTEGGIDKVSGGDTLTSKETVAEDVTDKDVGTTTISGTDTTTDSGKDIITGNKKIVGTDNVTDGGVDKSDKTTQLEQSVTYTESRTGNIGVTTSQQMIESEMALRMGHRLLEYMFTDMDTILTIPKY